MVYLRFLHNLASEAERWVPGWPADHHEEPDLDRATEKVRSGHYALGPPQPAEPAPAAEPAGARVPVPGPAPLPDRAETAPRPDAPGFAPGIIPDPETPSDASETTEAPSGPSDEPTAALLEPVSGDSHALGAESHAEPEAVDVLEEPEHGD